MEHLFEGGSNNPYRNICL